MKFLPVTNFIDTWYLTRDAFLFFSREKSLNFFPLLTLAILSISFGFTLAWAPSIFELHDYFWPLLLLLVALFIINSCNLAVTALVLKRLKNNPANLRDGVHAVLKHFTNLVGYTFICATVGVPAKLFEGLQTILKRFTGYTPTYTWSRATYFILPLMLQKNIGPINAMQQSCNLIGKEFTHTIRVKALAAVIFIITLLVVSEFLPLYPLLMLHILICLLPLFIITLLLANTLETIVTCAIYLNLFHYHKLPTFDPNILNRAFIREQE